MASAKAEAGSVLGRAAKTRRFPVLRDLFDEPGRQPRLQAMCSTSWGLTYPQYIVLVALYERGRPDRRRSR